MSLGTASPTIELEPIAERHATAMFRWMTDPDVRENVGVHREPSLEASLSWVRKAIDDASIAAFAIVRAGEHVGNVVLDRIDASVRTARFSIYVGEPSARGGTGRRATRLVLDRAFGELGMNKVWLTVHVRNATAIRAYEAVGFRVEGVLRDEFLLRGELVSALYMGILRGELR